jgi:hypothetical protein
VSRFQKALELAKRGFRVFPLNGKYPAINAFESEATTDENKIYSWWHTTNGLELQNNIGICTTNMVVFDVDVKRNQGGELSYEIVGGVHDTFTVKTPSGGKHFYFNGPDSIGNIGIMPGLDVRSHHNYVVAPGSYINGEYTILKDVKLTTLPKHLLSLLKPPKIRKITELDITLDTPTAIANALEWLKTAPIAVEGKGGDIRTYETACMLTRNYGLSVTMAFGIMWDFYNPRCIPPWNSDELFKKIENASEYGKNTLGTAQPELQFNGTTIIPPIRENPYKFGVYKGNTVRAMDIKERPWIVNNFLMKEKPTIITAAGAAGKSSLTLSMVAHFAIGRDFGPYKLKRQGAPIACAVYNSEDDADEQTRRLLAVCQAYELDYDMVRSNIIIISRKHKKLRLAHAQHGAVTMNIEDVQFIVDVIKNNGIEIFSFDPLVSLHNCNENDNGQMAEVMEIILNIGEATGCATLLMHHTPKYAGRGDKGDPNASRGAGAIITSTRIAINITTCDKEEMQKFGLTETERLQHVRVDDAKGNYTDTKANRALMWLKWQTQMLMTGDTVGVLVPTEMANKSKDDKVALIQNVYNVMVQQGSASISLATAVKGLQVYDPIYEKMHVNTLREHISKALFNKVQIGKEYIHCTRTTDKSGKDIVLIKITTE